MRNNVNVSFLIQNRNYGRFLPQCIRSILTQKGLDLIDYEILGLDAGSNDGSRQIYTKMIGRYIDVTGLNQAQALNVALRIAKGKYIAWINSDDYYLPNFLRNQLPSLRYIENISAIFGIGLFARNNILLRFKTKIPKIWYILRNPLHKNRGFTNLLKHDKDLKKDHCSLCQPTVLIKKHWLTKVGGWNENLTYTIDLDLWFRLASISHLAFTTKMSAIVRIHNKNMGILRHDAQEKEAEVTRQQYKKTKLNPMLYVS